jgi:hypothetical protein
MLSDERLVQEIRSRVHSELSGLSPSEGLVDQVWAELESPEPFERRQPPAKRRFGRSQVVLGICVAATVAIVVTVAGVALLGGQRHPSGRSADSQEQPLLRILGVLRRPQTRADLPPALLRVLNQRDSLPLLGTPDLRSVRLAAVTTAGVQLFLVPYEPPATRSPSTLTSKLALPRRTASARARLERSFRAQGDTLLIQVMYHGRDIGGAAGASAETIQHQGQWTWSGGYFQQTTPELFLVVPDGVREVSLLVHASAGLTRVTGLVHNNVFGVQVPGASGGPPQNMIWYGPDGQVLRRFGNTATKHGPAAASNCEPKGLKLSVGQGFPGVTGEHDESFILTNESNRSCVMTGYPRVQFKTGSHYLPFHHRNGGGYVTGHTPQRVLIHPGGSGYFLVAKYRCDLRDLHVPTALSVTPPGTSSALTLNLPPLTLNLPHRSGVETLTYCGPKPSDPGNTLDISPIERSLIKTQFSH